MPTLSLDGPPLSFEEFDTLMRSPETPAPCSRCGTPCGLDADGLERPHTVPCGRSCELTAPGDVHDTCNGGCSECRRLATGCGGLREPCGRDGCSECGVHADIDGSPLCGMAPPSRRVAWTWDGVTCTACLAMKPVAP